MALPESAAVFLASQIERLLQVKPKRRIVFPEGDDARVQSAAERLQREGLVTPILLKQDAPAPEKEARKYARLYFERRRAKGITEVEAAEVAKKPLYTAALMVAAGDADGFVGGAVNTTAETVRAALTMVGTAPGDSYSFERVYCGSPESGVRTQRSSGVRRLRRGYRSIRGRAG